MAAFFSTQLDFIFFFYGFAFILLGTTCITIAKVEGRGEYWALLGAFGFAHGVGEWLDLTALIVGDSPAFATARIALMAISFVLLTEFARREASRVGLKLSPAIYLPAVLLIALGGAEGGMNVFGALARYSFGFIGSVATALVFARHSRDFSGATRSMALLTAAGFVAYAVAAGVIVPAAPFWPASVFNHGWFCRTTGIPIQLVRGLLACWIALSIWAIWGQKLILEVSSAPYTRYLHKQFIRTLSAMATILVLGWILTEFLGGIYKQNVEVAARGDIDLLASRLTVETATIEAMVKALGGSPAVLPLLTGGSRPENERAKSILDLDVEASGAKLGYILDRSGAVVAASGQRPAPASSPLDYGSSPYFQKSLAGDAGYHFAFDATSGEGNYYASYPVRGSDGLIVGVAVLEKSLDGFATDLNQFGRPYFFIDPNGIVVLTNRPNMLLRPLWPLSAATQAALGPQFGMPDKRPIMGSEIVDATWTNFGSDRAYVRRRYANHSQWSLALIMPTSEIFASRVLGIVITLLVTVMTLIYLSGRERWVHDTIQTDKRLKLQELARELERQACTDPLTSLFNRLKFNQALAIEILRAQRYQTPLSLVLFDIDHFKQINDAHGHPVGDNVLVQLSRFVASHIRASDLLARWGGEEFVILVPESDGRMACRFAEILRDAIRKVAFLHAGTVTCSFGIAEYDSADTAETLIARADEGLYRAKLNGRDRVEFVALPAVAEPDMAPSV